MKGWIHKLLAARKYQRLMRDIRDVERRALERGDSRTVGHCRRMASRLAHAGLCHAVGWRVGLGR